MHSTARFLAEEQIERIENNVDLPKHHVINPVESREASLAKPETLEENLSEPKPVASVDGFTGIDESALSALLSSMGLAMDLDDLKTLQAYFRDEEHRDPTVTEVRVVDTYWSDHCRHTTFSTHLDEVGIENPAVKDAYDRYLAAREEVYGLERAAKRSWTSRPSAPRRSRNAAFSPSSTRARRSTPALSTFPPR